MSIKPLLAFTALILAFPVAAQAETVTRTQTTITHDPGAVPPGTKSTTVLKGYRVTTGYKSPGAPVAGDPAYFKNETFVPVEEMNNSAPAASAEAEQRAVKTYQKRWMGNE